MSCEIYLSNVHILCIIHYIYIHLIHYILLSFTQAYKLWFIALKLPLMIFIAIGAIFPIIISNMPKNNPLVNIHHGVCTILVAIGLSEFICNTAKVYVGRLVCSLFCEFICSYDNWICTNRSYYLLSLSS